MFRVSHLVFAAWLTLALAGFVAVWRYESAAGVAAVAARRPKPSPSPLPFASSAPSASDAFALDRARPTVFVFAHPDCPCTQATLDGLAEVAEGNPGRARIVVAIVGKGGTSNADAARRIPGAAVVADPDGAAARRFGAVTSGQTFAFAPDGTPLFQGGLTAVRGHYGPSAGLDALRSVLKGERPDRRATPVFGCALDRTGGAR